MRFDHFFSSPPPLCPSPSSTTTKRQKPRLRIKMLQRDAKVEVFAFDIQNLTLEQLQPNQASEAGGDKYPSQ